VGGRRWIGAAQAVLPPPTLSSTDLHVGDVVTVSGTGCLDPETGSGEGLTATVFRWRMGHGEVPTNPADLPVAADGSYAGEWTIDQDLPNGGGRAAVRCVGGSLDEFALRSEDLAVTGTAPSLPDIVGAPGAVVPMAYPCPNDDGTWFGVSILTDLSREVTIEFLEDSDGSAGPTLHGRIPADLAPGTYAASGACRSDGGTFADFNLRVIATSPGETPAPPAVSQPGSADFTG
jgi:hypothetical protein